ncbi:outer membrane beta-barrel protein [Massilia sp. MS-15]|uniref:outer membrane beta-barrel protein n=1 Tax=Massilia sp. MS-15 TaxID=2878200 RepID=UPI001CD48D2F|nr:outer membrane beta-barrel protein [Massilia sp. MS-15]MCA1248273.1 porin family protein [Massilia sp. MS-15]
MHLHHFMAAAALLAAGAARAQENAALQDGAPAATATARLEAATGARYGPLAEGFKRHAPLYGGNEAANPNDRLFAGFRTDPRLVIGYAFNAYLALEAGYAHLNDQGFHKIVANSPVESAIAAGALGVASNTTYVAARLTLPVNDRLTAYGKFGIAHSQVKNDGFVTPQQAAARAAGRQDGVFAGESATGAYGALGAKYKLNDRATLSGEYRVNGSASKFGAASNAGGLKGSVGIGF